MVRLFVYLLVISGVAAAITLLLSVDGGVEARVAGYVIHMPVSGLLIITLLALAAFGGLVWLSGYLLRLPEKLKRRRMDGQRQRGMIALTRGMEAVAAGDASDAQRFARNAQKNLDEPNLTRLLTAQAAQLAGDDATAEQAFSAMLSAPETEFLGLRGLYLQAQATGDHKSAKGYADRAFKLRPNARWAFESVYQLSIERGAWGEAKDALRLASKNGLAEGEHVGRKEAALLTARAHAAEAGGEDGDALKDLHAALKLSPGFSPAVNLAARLEARKGNKSKAARLLEDAWAIDPHPAIAQRYAELYAEEPVEKQTARMIKLADKAPDRDESRLLKSEQYILLDQWEEARELLEPLLQRSPKAGTFRAMAKVMRGLYGDEKAEYWLEKAANAPLDSVPGAEGDFHFTTDGWRRLIVEFGEHARLAPPPLENVSTAMSADEVRLLTAAPPAPEPVVEEIVEEVLDLDEVTETVDLELEVEQSVKIEEKLPDPEPTPPPPDAVVTGLPEEEQSSKEPAPTGEPKA